MKIALALLLGCGIAVAQVPDADAEGCKDSKLVNRIKGCVITECRVAEHDEAELPVASKGDEITNKTLEGVFEKIQFVCPEKIGPLQILRNMQNAFTTAGYEKVFEGRFSSERRLYTSTLR